MSLTRPEPDRRALLTAAELLARSGHGIEPPLAEFEERIEYVLFGRKQGWAELEAGTIDPVELRELLIAHFDYECADLSGRSWAQLPPELRAAVVAAVDAALQG